MVPIFEYQEILELVAKRCENVIATAMIIIIIISFCFFAEYNIIIINIKKKNIIIINIYK